MVSGRESVKTHKSQTLFFTGGKCWINYFQGCPPISGWVRVTEPLDQDIVDEPSKPNRVVLNLTKQLCNRNLGFSLKTEEFSHREVDYY